MRSMAWLPYQSEAPGVIWAEQWEGTLTAFGALMRVGQEKYTQRDDHPPHRQASEGVGTDSEEAELDRQEDKKRPAYHEKNCHQDANVTPRPAAVRAALDARRGSPREPPLSVSLDAPREPGAEMAPTGGSPSRWGHISCFGMLWHQFVYVVLSLKVVYCGCGHSPEASHYHSTPPTDDKGKLTQYQQCFYGLWIHVTTLFSGAPRASYATHGNGEAT